ncbi:MAG TPA: hypothetical protein VJ904_04045 [Tichowtungia sp.]|nr:hypothetical protein [Tichowtungia sp.]
MKTLLSALFVASLAAPAAAMSIDMNSLTPTLTFPEPAPTPVTQDNGGISK